MGAASLELLRADVAFVEEDKLLSGFGVREPNDPDLPQQWALYRLGLFEARQNNASEVQSSSADDAFAWSRTQGARDITVCVIDSGLDYTHPDLEGNVWTNDREIPWNGIDDDDNGFVDDYYGFNFLNDTGNVSDGALLLFKVFEKLRQRLPLLFTFANSSEIYCVKAESEVHRLPSVAEEKKIPPFQPADWLIMSQQVKQR